MDQTSQGLLRKKNGLVRSPAPTGVDLPELICSGQPSAENPRFEVARVMLVGALVGSLRYGNNEIVGHCSSSRGWPDRVDSHWISAVNRGVPEEVGVDPKLVADQLGHSPNVNRTSRQVSIVIKTYREHLWVCCRRPALE